MRVAEAIAVLAPGKVLQVLQVTKTDTFTTSSGTFVDITGLSVAITPSSSSNKILVTACVNLGNSGDKVDVILVRDSTPIAVGDAASNRLRLTFGGTRGVADNHSESVTYLDEPATASEVTYKLQMLKSAGGTPYLNRTFTDTDTDAFGRYISTITVMEVAV